ncbi:MAG: enoyl-CoA hydratase/isomerase family protein, partial [Chloroflexi bacterium]
MDERPVLTEKLEGGVGLIRLNRPKQLNALNRQVLALLA